MNKQDYSKRAFIKHKEKIYERNKESRDKLKDYIIVKYLRASGWKREDITQELIEVKRQEIILKRLINGKMDNYNDLNQELRVLAFENKVLKKKNKILIDAVLILKNGLHSVANLDDELEDIYADSGYLAQEVLESYKIKMKELNVNAE